MRKTARLVFASPIGTHTNSTIDIADPLLAEAEQAAAREGTTLRALVEAGLRHVLRVRRLRSVPFALRRASFKSEGLRPELQDQPQERIRSLTSEDHCA